VRMVSAGWNELGPSSQKSPADIARQVIGCHSAQETRV
jgi:hypothetical protein